MTLYHIVEKIPMTDYQITAKIRVNDRHPKEWIVDALYEQLDRKNLEDIIEWYVTECKTKQAKRPKKVTTKEVKK
jgi:hypothetical protein